MKRILILFIFFSNAVIYAQETDENSDDGYYDFTSDAGVTIFGERPDLDAVNAYVLNQLSGTLSDRKQFIETDFLEGAGFRRTANVKYRKSDSSEKALSVLHGFAHLFSLGIVPMKPFFEIEYDKLPKGKYYNFDAVFIKSNFKNVSPDVLTIIELEYMLQVEFFNGIIIHDNINYYTDEYIDNFENLILRLPDYPENINQIKNRYLRELQKIRSALERHRNPSENWSRALQNMGNNFKMK